MTLAHPAGRILTALGPLMITPGVSWAIAGGYLNFGGGEKDIILLVPWVLWSIIFASAALLCWWRRVALGRSLLWATVWATGTLVVLGLVLGPVLLGTALYLKVPGRHLTLILLANSDGLRWESRFDEAVIERFPFAMAFLKAFSR